MKEKRNLYEERSMQKKEWLYWANRIGRGTREEQIDALKNEKSAYKKLLEIEEEIKRGVK
jgi:MarR-like DNA-binding transcriptional regulator SgrR of sgrS sRNA